MVNQSFASPEDFLGTERRFKEARLWNGKKILIRSLLESEWTRIEMGNYDTASGKFSENGLRLSNARLIIATVCSADPDSPNYKQPMFKDDQLKAMFNADVIVTQPLIKTIREHCGLRVDMEELLKNSAATGGEDSPSFSAERLPEENTGST